MRIDQFKNYHNLKSIMGNAIARGIAPEEIESISTGYLRARFVSESRGESKRHVARARYPRRPNAKVGDPFEFDIVCSCEAGQNQLLCKHGAVTARLLIQAIEEGRA